MATLVDAMYEGRARRLAAQASAMPRSGSAPNLSVLAEAAGEEAEAAPTRGVGRALGCTPRGGGGTASMPNLQQQTTPSGSIVPPSVRDASPSESNPPMGS
jgi:hypothetical protein